MIPYLRPGDDLLNLLAGAQARAIIASPFIKRAAFERLIDALPADVELTVYTRWRAEEVARGVSDPSIFDLLSERKHAGLRLCDRLHAKIFVADDAVLVGSSNVTGAGLGWSRLPNLELLCRVPASDGPLLTALNALEVESIPATSEYRDRIECLAEAMPIGRMGAVDEFEELVTNSSESWLPSLRNPEMLHAAYEGRWEELSFASQEAARRDLAAIAVPEGLELAVFREYVGAILLAQPQIAAIDCRLEEPRRFGYVTDLLVSRELAADRAAAQECWQTLMRWLFYFLPGRYARRVFSYSEVVGRSSGFRD